MNLDGIVILAAGIALILSLLLGLLYARARHVSKTIFFTGAALMLSQIMMGLIFFLLEYGR